MVCQLNIIVQVLDEPVSVYGGVGIEDAGAEELRIDVAGTAYFGPRKVVRGREVIVLRR